jgi:hypothetical protein
MFDSSTKSALHGPEDATPGEQGEDQLELGP